MRTGHWSDRIVASEVPAGEQWRTWVNWTNKNVWGFDKLLSEILNPHISRGWRAFGFGWILSCLSVGIALSTLWAQKTPLPPQFARMSSASAERYGFHRQLGQTAKNPGKKIL